MEPTDIKKLVEMLYESSILMRGISENTANVLLEMSSEVLTMIESPVSEEDIQEIEDIKKEICS